MTDDGATFPPYEGTTTCASTHYDYSWPPPPPPPERFLPKILDTIYGFLSHIFDKIDTFFWWKQRNLREKEANRNLDTASRGMV